MSPEPEVALRPFRDSDWPAVHAWARDPQVCRYQPWGPNSEAETREFVMTAIEEMDRRPQTRWAYAVLLGRDVVGVCELNLRGQHQGEISYVLRADQWGQGVATVAARQVVAFGFSDLGLHRIFATCDPRNARSSKLMRRLGMQLEGRLRETVLLRDGWRDSDVYGLLVNEWGQGAVVSR